MVCIVKIVKILILTLVCADPREGCSLGREDLQHGLKKFKFPLNLLSPPLFIVIKVRNKGGR